jgi:hypothetical protein
MNTRDLLANLLVGACVASISAPARAAEWSTSAGVDYESGDFGQAADTTIWQVPLSVSVSDTRWSATLTVPYVHLKGTGAVIPTSIGFGAGPSSGGGASTSGGAATGSVTSSVSTAPATGGVSIGGAGGAISIPGVSLGGVLGGAPTGSATVGTTTTTTTPGTTAAPATPAAPAAAPFIFEADGVGDTVLQGAFVPWIGAGGGRFTIIGTARLPTGDENKALGAGEVVGSIAGALSVPIAPRAAIYGSVGYSRAFDSETDGMFAGAGIEAYVSQRMALGGGFSWSEASVAGADDRSTASLSAAFDTSARSRFLVYASAGLSDSSPDFGAGVGLSVRY